LARLRGGASLVLRAAGLAAGLADFELLLERCVVGRLGGSVSALDSDVERETGLVALVGRDAARRPGRRVDEGSGSARRVGVSQYGHRLQRGSTGLPHDSHGSLMRARQLGQRR